MVLVVGVRQKYHPSV